MKFKRVYISRDGFLLSAKEYASLIEREAAELGISVEEAYASEDDYKPMVQCVICGEIVGMDESHDWDHEDATLLEEDIPWRDIAEEALYQFLTAEYGWKVVVFADGTWCIEPSQTAFGAVISRVKCPGIGNLDRTPFLEDFAREENGKYVSIKDGHPIGDGSLEDVIRDCVANGDMEGFIDELERRLVESFQE